MSEKKPDADFEVKVEPATALLRELVDRGHDFSRLVGAHLEVNQTDFDAMVHLIENGPMSAGELSVAVGISPGSTTVMIDRLVAIGHVTRQANPKDRRGVLVAPNPASIAEAWKHISPLISASEKVLASMSATERKAIEKYLRTMLEAYSHG